MAQKYMMNVDDVMEALDVKRSTAYKIMRELNESLKKEGYKVICGKIPRTYLEAKFYGGNKIFE